MNEHGNVMRFHYIKYNSIALFVAVSAFTVLSCASVSREQCLHVSDFSTEGFIDNGHFQVFVTGMPSREKKTLVERRESSLADIPGKIKSRYVGKISEYISAGIEPSTNGRNKKDAKEKTSPDVPSEVAARIQQLMAYDREIAMLYNEDGSVTAVHRMCRPGLRDEIQGLRSQYLPSEDVSKKQ